MSSQKAIAAVRQFAPAKDNGVSFVKELTIGLVLGLAAGAVWKVDLRPPSPPRSLLSRTPGSASRSIIPCPSLVAAVLRRPRHA